MLDCDVVPGNKDIQRPVIPIRRIQIFVTGDIKRCAFGEECHATGKASGDRASGDSIAGTHRETALDMNALRIARMVAPIACNPNTPGPRQASARENVRPNCRRHRTMRYAPATIAHDSNHTVRIARQYRDLGSSSKSPDRERVSCGDGTSRVRQNRRGCYDVTESDSFSVSMILSDPKGREAQIGSHFSGSCSRSPSSRHRPRSSAR